MYAHEDITTPIIMNCTISTSEAIKFKSRSGFKQHDIILSKEQLVISKQKLMKKVTLTERKEKKRKRKKK